MLSLVIGFWKVNFERYSTKKELNEIDGLKDVPPDIKNDYEVYRIAIRKIAANTNERTLISTVIPKNALAGHSLSVNFPFCQDIKNYNTLSLSYEEIIVVASLLNSFTLDYVLRARMTTNQSLFYLYQLPVLRIRPDDPQFKALIIRATKLICTTPEFDDLAKEVGLGSHRNGITDEVGRAKLRAEIDGIVAHLYGLTEAEFAHILGASPTRGGAGQGRGAECVSGRGARLIK